MPKHRRNCQLNDELNENSRFKIYSKANCMYECEVGKAYEFCQCIPWDYFHELKSNGTAPECDVFGRTCFDKAMSTIAKEKMPCEHCIEECDVMNFYTKILSEKNLISDGNPYMIYT